MREQKKWMLFGRGLNFRISSLARSLSPSSKGSLRCIGNRDYESEHFSRNLQQNEQILEDWRRSQPWLYKKAAAAAASRQCCRRSLIQQQQPRERWFHCVKIHGGHSTADTHVHCEREKKKRRLLPVLLLDG